MEEAYAKVLVPALRRHDLEESPDRGRDCIEGVFCRLEIDDVERQEDGANAFSQAEGSRKKK